MTMEDQIPTKNGHTAESQSLMENGQPNGGHQTGQDGNEGSATPSMPFMMMLLRRRLHYLPVLTTILIVGSFFVSYGISVYHGHVEPDFPYISTCLSSYAAIHAPERCIFAQLVNFGAFMLAGNVYIRYKQMREVLKLLNAARRDHIVNTVSLVMGFLSAFGLTMVANFQTVVMRPGHYTGAGLAFILGMVYCWMQTSLSIRYSRWSCVAIAQLINSIVLTTCLIVFSISKTIYKIREGQGHGTKWDTLRAVYLVSTVSEWLTAMSIVTFALTFCRDFARISLKSPTVKIEDQNAVLEDYRIGSIASSGSATPSDRQNGTMHDRQNGAIRVSPV